MTLRPRRSLLYMPGSNTRALEKARTLPADGLIFDLEDAVAPSAKETARKQIIETLSAGGYGPRELIVRVNGLDTPWGEADLGALLNCHADAVLLPKVSSPKDLHRAIDVLNKAGVSDDLPVWIMAETARCILDIGQIAASHPRLAAIVVGTSDLARELRVRHTPNRQGLLTALSLCVLAARANALSVIDGVHLDLEDNDGLAATCQQGRDLGFDGKSLIHPLQLAVSNKSFSPSENEIERSREIVAAWNRAVSLGKGVVVVDGRLVEQLHVDEAHHTLALAKSIVEMELN